MSDEMHSIGLRRQFLVVFAPNPALVGYKVGSGAAERLYRLLKMAEMQKYASSAKRVMWVVEAGKSVKKVYKWIPTVFFLGVKSGWVPARSDSSGAPLRSARWLFPVLMGPDDRQKFPFFGATVE
jgi:hypothetical protein